MGVKSYQLISIKVLKESRIQKILQGLKTFYNNLIKR